MSSFLFKETNYTKRGKIVKGRSWNSYPQMLKTISHSLRLQDTSKNLHIITSKSKDNIIVSATNETLLYDYIKNKIALNIKSYENINTKEEDRKKLFKDFSNAKLAITKKIPKEILDIELKNTSNEKEILKNCVYKHKLKLKAKDKRTLKTLKRYIVLKDLYEAERQHKKYNNQVLLKEVLFKIPENQTLNLNNDQWKTIIDKFKKEYFDDYEMFFSAIHNDEGKSTEIKGHVHMFLSGYNANTKNFDIKKHIFDKILNNHDLDLDYNSKDNHKKIMNLFQKDFYTFFNTQLSQMGIKDKIELNQYQTIEDLNKRLKINQEDYLTINEKHAKLANKIVEEEFTKYDKENNFQKIKFEISENSFSNSLSIKTNLKNKKNNNRVKVFTKMLAISQYFSKYVKKLSSELKTLKDKLLQKDKEIEKLKNDLEYEKLNQQRDFIELEKDLKMQFEKEKDYELKTIELQKDKIIAEKEKEIDKLTDENSTMLDFKQRYIKFEKVFGINISKKLKDYRASRKKHIGHELELSR